MVNTGIVPVSVRASCLSKHLMSPYVTSEPNYFLHNIVILVLYLHEGNLLSQTNVGQLERKLKGSPRSMDSM